MFQILKRLWKDREISMEDFWKPDNPIGEVQSQILLELSLKINWKTNRKLDLLERIKRIASNKNFSARDTKLLRKLVLRQQKNGYQDFEEISQYFPGKSVEMIREYHDKRFKQKEFNSVFDSF